jgi:predicted metalloendopeptidase
LEADGLTDEELRHRQREFFLGLANLWQSDADEETLLEYHKIDEHAADHVRVNGISRLIDDWYTLFGVEPGDELYVKPEDRVKIW